MMQSVFARPARGRAKQTPRDVGIASSSSTPRNDGRGIGGFLPASLLTRAELLDHARHPRNRGALAGADIVQEEANPLCGDVVTVYAKVEPTTYNLQPITFVGSGCIISQAASSMLTEAVRGKSVDEVLRMEREDMEALLGGQLSPSRVKCGMLALIALKRGLGAKKVSGTFSSSRRARRVLGRKGS